MIPVLTIAALLAVPAAASGEQGPPEFRLNSVKVSALPVLSTGEIPPVSPPRLVGYYPAAEAGGISLNSSVKVAIQGAEGSAEIKFPRAEYGRAGTGYRASLFVKFAASDQAAVLSWATVLCSGRRYQGYKGSSLKLPDSSGDFRIKDLNLSLGRLKYLLGSTHPWLVPAAAVASHEGLDRLCSAGFAAEMKSYNVKALPREAAGYSFTYAERNNALAVSWHK